MSNNITALVSLDCLMDTRMGTLKRLNPEAAEKLQASWYHKRTTDTFDRNGSGINQKAFQALYEARDEDTLKQCMMTQLPRHLMALIASLTTTQGMPLLAEQFTIHINLYPYNLSEPVRIAIRQAIEVYTNNAAVVEMVDYSPADLGLSLLKHTYDICFMYDFNEWLMLHTEEFKTIQIPEVRVVTPRLYLKEAPTQLLEKVKGEEYGWEQMALLFVGLVGVVFMDVNIFSIVSEHEPNLNA